MPDENKTSITVTDETDYSVLALHNPPLNTLTIPIMESMQAAFEERAAKSSPPPIFVTSSLPKFFCNGLDPEMILSRDLDGRKEVFATLFRLVHAMYAYPGLTFACIDGHAYAGGAVLGIVCDFRLAAAGRQRFCFSEVPVGLTIPRVLLHIIEEVVGRGALRDVAMLGTAYEPEDALSIGLIDAVLPSTGFFDACLAYARPKLELAPRSVRHVKNHMRRTTIEELRQSPLDEDPELEGFLTGDFEEGLRAVLERRPPRFQRS